VPTQKAIVSFDTMAFLSLSKSLFDKLSNANRGAGFAFEKAARCGAALYQQ